MDIESLPLDIIEELLARGAPRALSTITRRRQAAYISHLRACFKGVTSLVPPYDNLAVFVDADDLWRAQMLSILRFLRNVTITFKKTGYDADSEEVEETVHAGKFAPERPDIPRDRWDAYGATLPPLTCAALSRRWTGTVRVQHDGSDDTLWAYFHLISFVELYDTFELNRREAFMTRIPHRERAENEDLYVYYEGDDSVDIVPVPGVIDPDQYIAWNDDTRRFMRERLTLEIDAGQSGEAQMRIWIAPARMIDDEFLSLPPVAAYMRYAIATALTFGAPQPPRTAAAEANAGSSIESLMQQQKNTRQNDLLRKIDARSALLLQQMTEATARHR